MTLEMINNERQIWLRALQRGAVTQERYDKMIALLDECEAMLK